LLYSLCCYATVPTVDANSKGGSGQRVDGTLVGGIVGGIVFVATVTVVVIISLFLWYR